MIRLGSNNQPGPPWSWRVLARYDSSYETNRLAFTKRQFMIRFGLYLFCTPFMNGEPMIHPSGLRKWDRGNCPGRSVGSAVANWTRGNDGSQVKLVRLGWAALARRHGLAPELPRVILTEAGPNILAGSTPGLVNPGQPYSVRTGGRGAYPRAHYAGDQRWPQARCAKAASMSRWGADLANACTG